MNGVEVPLQIYEDVKIPQGAGFIVGRSGLPGRPLCGYSGGGRPMDRSRRLQPGTRDRGRTRGRRYLDDLTQQATAIAK